MARKGLGSERARKGTIASRNYLNDRARTVERLFKVFKNRLESNKRVKMITKCENILRTGQRKRLFDGKDPYVAGVAIFVAVTRHFSYNLKCPVTYDEIRNECGPFASASTFTSMLRLLAKEFSLQNLYKK